MSGKLVSGTILDDCVELGGVGGGEQHEVGNDIYRLRTLELVNPYRDLIECLNHSAKILWIMILAVSKIAGDQGTRGINYLLHF